MTTLPSPWGPVHLAATRTGVCGVELRGSVSTFAREVEARIGGRVTSDDQEAQPGARAMLGRARAEVLRALAGDRSAVQAVPLDWRGVNPWDRRVLEGTRTLAGGEVTSYGRLARRIGAPGAARAVGAALGRNPFWILVPCHRVVAGDGTIGGYGDQPDALEIKRDLLALEGTALPVARLAD